MTQPMDDLQVLSEYLLSNKCDIKCITIINTLRSNTSECYRFFGVVMDMSNSLNDDIVECINQVYDSFDTTLKANDFELSLLLKALLYLRAGEVPGMHDIPDSIALQLERFMSPSLRGRLLELEKYEVDLDNKETLQWFASLPDGMPTDGGDLKHPPRGPGTR